MIYQSIYECPAWNFVKARDDKRYLMKLESYHKLPDPVDGLEEAYEEMYYQFIDEFGIGSTEGMILNLERDILELEVSYSMTGNQTLLARIGVMKQRLEELISKSTGGNVFQLAAQVSKWAGYEISALRLTVVEFYSKIKEYEKAVKSSK